MGWPIIFWKEIIERDMEGSRFFPDPVCRHISETLWLLGRRVLAGGSRERFATLPCPSAIDFVSDQRDKVRPRDETFPGAAC